MTTKIPDHWEFGDQILLRGVWRDRLWFAIIAYVVQDDDDLIALYWHAGTPNRRFQGAHQPKNYIAEDQPELVKGTWTRTNLLMLVKPGAAHSVELLWDQESGEHLCWYVNLQEPLRRTPLGFDTMDQALDVVISPDKIRWRWKDEEEFAEMCQLGLFSADEARAIRAEGESVIQLAMNNLPPFSDAWEKWKPPKDWRIPEFPAEWETIFE